MPRMPDDDSIQSPRDFEFSLRFVSALRALTGLFGLLLVLFLGFLAFSERKELKMVELIFSMVMGLIFTVLLVVIALHFRSRMDEDGGEIFIVYCGFFFVCAFGCFIWFLFSLIELCGGKPQIPLHM